MASQSATGAECTESINGRASSPKMIGVSGPIRSSDQRNGDHAARVVHRRPGAQESDPVKHHTRRRRIEIALGIAVPILLIGGWELASKTNALDPRFFPAPSDLWSTGVNLYAHGQMESLIWDSVHQVLEGFFLGSVAGLLFGIGLGSSAIVRSALEPVVYALWTIPKLALLPLLLLIFGLGETPVILLIAVECMFLVMIPTIAAIVSVPQSYREVAISFDATRWQTFRYVTLPAALPQMFVALRLAAGASVLVMVAAEFIDGQSGLGYYIFNSWQLFATNQMYVAIVTVALIGGIWMTLVTQVGRSFTRWERVGN